MKKFLFLLLTLFLAKFSFAKQPVVVAAAANTEFAVKDIAKLYEKKFHTPVKIILSASGKLANQIVRGAPYHVFLSADMKYPTFVYKRGYALTKPKVYAYGVLVLWTLKDIPLKQDLRFLLSPSIKKIGVPNPRLAPYGRQAVNALRYYHIYDKVRPKLIFGESVGQTSQYIYKKLVDVGFTAKSIVLSPVLKERGKWVEVNPKAYKPIAQGVVLLKAAKDNEDAKRFYNFLFSQEAKKIWQKYGYKVQ